jgi:AraC-like DNA-binding protein
MVFMQGCPYRCPYCHNPDTREFIGGKEFYATEIADKAERYKTYFGNEGGVTVSGGEPLCQREFLTELFTELHKRGINTCIDTAGIKPDENQAMRSVVQYCSRNFTKDLSLAILEEELHLSKYYISHLFGDKLGIRFNDYINSLRISEACKLLGNSDLSVTEISERVGFNTLRTFNRAFVKQIGLAPSEYRRSEAAAPLPAP